MSEKTLTVKQLVVKTPHTKRNNRMIKMFIVLATVGTLGISDAISFAGDKCTAELKSMVSELRKTGLVMRIAEGGYAVYVSRAWYGMPLQQKQALAWALQECVSPGLHVTIYDGFTGKKLARYGSSWGYSNYED